MVALLTTLGIVLFFLGLLFSIAWHELGHFATARMFGIRCTQFMVGFGKTLWSRKRGETEFGLKLVPLGGYVRIVGMIPPAAKPRDTSGKPMSRWRAMIEDAREANTVELEPGDEDRQFYQRAPWKRIIVMAAGPVMNLILAVILFSIIMMGIGLPQSTTTVDTVARCVLPADSTATECPAAAPPTPAMEAGIRPGDRIVAVDGEPTPDWEAANVAIRESMGPTEITLERGGDTRTVTADIIENQVVARDDNGDVLYETDANGEPVTDEDGYRVPRTEPAGFLGITFAQERAPLSVGESAATMWQSVVGVGQALIELPSRVDDVFRAAFLGEERTVDSPVGIVGASRIGGEVLAQPIPAIDRVVFLVNMLAGVNLFLFAFNMVPILPLDGGHIFGALWEWVRRGVARLFRKPDPGPFDVAQLMPFAYIVVACFVVFSLMLLVADVVNPVRLTQ
ncbi:M50 family metallopeptidase [Streptomonospora nanhaiensis]|uniref:Membrane-associated protease RseP (Regulator of RpoE activity) n=1 Tax=Streptomonospora nanhaiensis TaxID=1323731 RepID=A0A853BUD1_9ACTN|nr:site-2 protease family protein [Streptomonospora nanhaiensis]MBV2365839.1 site-2 protease family protein [Streptomonospora nanhaiensis]MBX9390828.1 site-2 protease family protein [Streptomonospora nanhaiensis]NYI98127.1 membrane-associated protease RseP (regulator of RpoE activity) [Streptomonospora nanhaiensis]